MIEVGNCGSRKEPLAIGASYLDLTFSEGCSAVGLPEGGEQRDEKNGLTENKGRDSARPTELDFLRSPLERSVQTDTEVAWGDDI